MPTDIQIIGNKVDNLTSDVSYIKGRVDTVFPEIATKEYVKAAVKEGLSEHTTECWKNATYEKAQRLKDVNIGRPSLIPQSKKTITVLAGAIVSLVGLLTFVFTKLIEYLTKAG